MKKPAKTVGELAERGGDARYPRYSWDHYRKPEPGPGEGGPLGSVTGWAPAKDGEWVAPTWLSGGDYAGTGAVERSNYETFLKDREAHPDVRTFYGGYGTFGVLIRASCADAEILQVLAGLEDYPILDEEALSETEASDQDEAWEDWARSDYLRELRKKYPDAEAEVDALEDLPADNLRGVFEEMCERANVFWQEDGNGQWIDLEKVAAAGLPRPCRECFRLPEPASAAVAKTEWYAGHAAEPAEADFITCRRRCGAGPYCASCQGKHEAGALAGRCPQDTLPKEA